MINFQIKTAPPVRYLRSSELTEDGVYGVVDKDFRVIVKNGQRITLLPGGNNNPIKNTDLTYQQFYLIEEDADITVEFKPKEKSRPLDITHEEAYVLNNILGHVGGPPEGTRGYADSLLEKLSKICFSGNNLELDEIDLTVDEKLGSIIYLS